MSEDLNKLREIVEYALERGLTVGEKEGRWTEFYRVFTPYLAHDLIARLQAAEERAEALEGSPEGDTWWKIVIGEGASHAPSGEISVKHLHPLAVKPIYEAHRGTAVADVIAGLIFKLAITQNREEFLVKDAAKRTEAAEERAEKLEGALAVVRMSRGWQYMSDETKALIDAALKIEGA